MKFKILYVLLFGSFLFGPQKAASSDDWHHEVDSLREDILVLQRQMYRSGMSDDAPAVKTSADSANGDVQVKIGEYDEIIRKINGRMDTLEHDIKSTNEKLDKINRDMEIRFKILEGKQVPANLSAPTTVQPTTYSSPTAQNPAKSVMGDSISGSDLEPIAPVIAPKQKDAPEALVPDNDLNIVAHTENLPTKPVTAEEMYQNAMQAYNAGLTDEAEIAFKQILSEHPKDKMAGNAQYWLGETYLKTNQLDKAKIAFKNGYENYPDGNKTADSLFKLGITLERQGDTKNACIVYSSFPAAFPKANAELSNRVKTQSDKLKCK